MISLRIREDHVHGPLYVTRTTDLAVALDDTRNVVELGDPEDALLVAERTEEGGLSLDGLDLSRDDEGTFVLSDGEERITLGDEDDALLVAKCIEVAAGDRDRSDLTEQELERLDDLQNALL